MQFIVDFKDGILRAQVDEYLAANNATIVDTYDSFSNVFVVSAPSRPLISEIVESIVDDDANPISLLGYSALPGDDYAKVQFDPAAPLDWWKLATVNNSNVTNVQSIDRRGHEATVYVVDSGVMSGHPDLANVTVSHLYAFNGDIIDYNGHGTAIASVISGEQCGLTAAKIKSVKIFQNGVQTLQSHLIAAFDAIIQDVIANPNTFPIVNLSWAIPKNEYVEAKIRLMIQAGVVVIAAAGNSGTAIENVTPASMSEVCTVGAYGQNFEPCSFSNYTGDLSTTPNATNYGALDVWAPGELIRIAKLDGTLGTAAGTSIAAAIHSAAVAYNSILAVLATGQPATTIMQNGQAFAASTSGKQGILHLSGQYAASVNRVSKLNAYYDGDAGVTYPGVSHFRFTGRAGTQVQWLMFNPLSVASWTFNTPLPDGLSVDSAGWLTGTINVPDITVFESNVTYTKLGGLVSTSNVTILIIPEGKESEAAGSADPVIISTLTTCGRQFNSSSGLYYCGGSCGPGGGPCYDACGYVESKVPSNLQCECTANTECW